MRKIVLLGMLLIGGGLAAPGCDGGGGNDGGTDGGSDSGTGTDSGTPDAGPDGGVPSCVGFTAPTVPLQISSTCSGFVPCGGNPTGRWVYDGGCAINPYPSVLGPCTQATISSPTGTISGCISFSGALSGTVVRQVGWTVTATVHFPSTPCVPTNCADLQTVVRGYYPGATCSAVTGGCDCAVSTTGGVNDNTAYVVTGTEIIAGGVPYPFCVVGSDVIQYREGGSSPQLPVGDLRRR